MSAMSGRAWVSVLCQSRRLRRRGCDRRACRAELHTTTAAQWSPGQPPPKAAALVIGNEVLSGKITDTNTAWLARLLYARGVDLVRVEVVPDVPDDIAASARSLSARVGPSGFVFTSGGIGPTHDDVTYESLAAAFGVPLALHAPTVAKMRVHYQAQGKELNAARLRMATLPEGCVVHDTPNSWVPLVQVANVYVLPGVPWLYKQMLEANRGLFTGPQLLTRTLYTHTGEGDLAAALTAVASDHSAVSIGSYPNTARGDASFATKLCFDGRDAGALEAAVNATRAVIATFDELPPSAA